MTKCADFTTRLSEGYEDRLQGTAGNQWLANRDLSIYILYYDTIRITRWAVERSRKIKLGKLKGERVAESTDDTLDRILNLMDTPVNWV